MALARTTRAAGRKKKTSWEWNATSTLQCIQAIKLHQETNVSTVESAARRKRTATGVFSAHRFPNWTSQQLLPLSCHRSLAEMDTYASQLLLFRPTWITVIKFSLVEHLTSALLPPNWLEKRHCSNVDSFRNQGWENFFLKKTKNLSCRYKWVSNCFINQPCVTKHAL